MADKAFYVDLTRDGPHMGFAKCRTWREPKTYAEYVGQFPKCVTTSWLESLPEDEKEREARVRYAYLVKQIEVMKACHEPGNRPIYTASSLPEGIDVFKAVESLQQEHDKLVGEIKRGERCADHKWRPPDAQVVKGFFDSSDAGDGAKDPELWEQVRQERYRSVQGRRWQAGDSAWVSRIYQERYAKQHGISNAQAADGAWNAPPVHREPKLDLTRPEGNGFAQCGPRKASSYLDYVSRFPKCVAPEKLEKMLAKPDSELRVEYAVLAKQVALMERCYGKGDAPVYVKTEPNQKLDVKKEVERLRARHEALALAIERGERCKKQTKSFTTAGPATADAVDHYLAVVEQTGFPLDEQHLLAVEQDLIPRWYVERSFASLGHEVEALRRFLDEPTPHAVTLVPNEPAVRLRDLRLERDPDTMIIRSMLRDPEWFGDAMDRADAIDPIIEIQRSRGLDFDDPLQTLRQILELEEELQRLEQRTIRQIRG